MMEERAEMGVFWLIAFFVIIIAFAAAIGSLIKWIHKKRLKNKPADEPKSKMEDDQNRTAEANEWKCPYCGKINQNYVGTCGCGQVKGQPRMEKIEKKPSLKPKEHYPQEKEVILEIHLDKTKLKQERPDYRASAGRMIACAVPPSMLSGVMITTNESEANGRDPIVFACQKGEYVVGLYGCFYDLDKVVDKLINSKTIRESLSPAGLRYRVLRGAFVSDGVITKEGTVICSRSFCAYGFEAAWEEKKNP